MKHNLAFDFSVNKENNSIEVKREFAAELQKVWAAWTESKLLDRWWAPKPYRAQTKSMDFSVGGSWLYSMVGPNGEEHRCRADYKSIEVLKNYSGLDAFCDENWNIMKDFPRSLWDVSFSTQGEHTLVTIITRYEKLEDLQKIIEMGFREGFTAALTNLDELLESQENILGQEAQRDPK